MICPNCGTQIETAGKFCASCGAQLPAAPPPPPPAAEAAPTPPPPAAEAAPPPAAEAAPTPPPPAWAQAPLPPATQLPPTPPPAPAWAQSAPPQPLPPVAGPPQWGQTPPPPPPPFGAAPYGGAWGQTPPPPGTYYAAQPVPASTGAAAGGSGSLLALIGGAVAVGSAWLPWMIYGGQWAKGIDATQSDLGLANGQYLVGAGALAAVCGLLLLLGVARSAGTRQLLALGAIAGAIGVCVVEAAAFMKMNDIVNATNSLTGGLGVDTGFAIGWGIYVGAAGGVIAGLGGLLSLSARAGAAGAAAGSQMLTRVIVLVALVAVGGAGIYALSHNSNANGRPLVTPTIVSVTPTSAPTGATTPAPTEAPTAGVTVAPTPAGSFITRGYSTPELAINQFVTDNSYSYGGDCSLGASGADYCSTLVSKVADGSIYALGPLAAEADGYVLVRNVAGNWYLVDQAPATTAPPWH